MKRNRIAVTLAVFAVLGVCAPVFAHHGQAAVDLNKKMTLKGTVTDIEWVNPHSHFSFDAKDETGKVTNWTMELTTPLMLARIGWTKDNVKVGDQVTATFYPSKNGAPVGILDNVVLADGTVLGRGGSTHAGEPGVKQ